MERRGLEYVGSAANYAGAREVAGADIDKRVAVGRGGSGAGVRTGVGRSEFTCAATTRSGTARRCAFTAERRWSDDTQGLSSDRRGVRAGPRGEDAERGGSPAEVATYKALDLAANIVADRMAADNERFDRGCSSMPRRCPRRGAPQPARASDRVNSRGRLAGDGSIAALVAADRLGGEASAESARLRSRRRVGCEGRAAVTLSDDELAAEQQRVSASWSGGSGRRSEQRIRRGWGTYARGSEAGGGAAATRRDPDARGGGRCDHGGRR